MSRAYWLIDGRWRDFLLLPSHHHASSLEGPFGEDSTADMDLSVMLPGYVPSPTQFYLSKYILTVIISPI